MVIAKTIQQRKLSSPGQISTLEYRDRPKHRTISLVHPGNRPEVNTLMRTSRSGEGYADVARRQLSPTTEVVRVNANDFDREVTL